MVHQKVAIQRQNAIRFVKVVDRIDDVASHLALIVEL